MKTLEELKKELEELEQREFMLQMCDHWDSSDYRLSWELNDKIKAKRQEITDAEMRVYGQGGI